MIVGYQFQKPALVFACGCLGFFRFGKCRIVNKECPFVVSLHSASKSKKKKKNCTEALKQPNVWEIFDVCGVKKKSEKLEDTKDAADRDESPFEHAFIPPTGHERSRHDESDPQRYADA